MLPEAADIVVVGGGAGDRGAHPGLALGASGKNPKPGGSTAWSIGAIASTASGIGAGAASKTFSTFWALDNDCTLR
jgi:hypothetical protein